VRAGLREESGQAKIVEHRITAAELEKMKGYLGVSEGGNYDLIINGHGTGLSPPTEEEWTQIAAKAMVVENVFRGSGSEPYFSSVDWSTSPWFPPIGDQDGEGSCVSWAVVYYTKTFQEAKEHGWNLTGARWEGVYPMGYPTPEYRDKIISPAFIYHLTNFGINTGTSFYDAINLVCSIGACSWAEMPWNPFDQATWPSESAWREAAYYRGASTQFEWIYVNPPSGILALKNLIASGNLAQIGVNASQYQWLTPQDVWTLDNYNPGGTDHANTIVGYDDNFAYTEQGQTRYGAFKIANSWGVGGWENVPDGFYWISYKAMSQRVQYATFYRDRIGYVPTLTSSFRIEHPLRGDCKITIGVGPHGNPDVSKNFTDYMCGGNFSFCPNNIVFDITEFKDVVPKIYGQQFFIRVYDSGTSTTGTILYFAVEDTVSSDYTSSSDPPVTTVNHVFVFADLIFGEWPMFHHDPSHTGTSTSTGTSTGPTTNNTLRTYTTGGGVYSSPAIVGGLVYVGSDDHNVYCLNAATGALVWNCTTGGPVWSSPVVVGGLVFVGSDDWKVYCLNAATGSLVWSYKTGSLVQSSPAVFGGFVYVGSWDDNVYCLNAATGSLVWSYKTDNAVYSSPAVFGGFVYVGSYDHNVYCLNATTGSLVWSYKTGSLVGSSPAVVSGLVFVGSDDWKVYCLNAATGSLVWSYKTGSLVQSSPAVFGGFVYVGSDDNSTYCLNAATGALVWRCTTGGAVVSSPVVVGGLVYVGSDDYNVYCLNAATGSLVWGFTTGGYVGSSPAVVNGVVYVGSEDGKIYAFGPALGDWWPMFHHDPSHTGTSTSTGPNTKQTAWNYATGSYVVSSPVVAEGVVYVGSADNKTYALNAKTGAQVWNYTTGAIIQWSSPAVAGGVVYVGSTDGNVYALNAKTGTKVWNHTTRSAVFSSPVVVGGLVYVGSDDYNVYCLNAATGALVWNCTTGGPVWSSPVVVGGLVFVGSWDGYVYCLNAATGALVWRCTTGGSVFSSPVVGGLVFVGSCDHNVYCLNAATGALVWRCTTGGSVFSSPAVAGGVVYVGSDDGNVYALNAATGTQVWKHPTGNWVQSSPAVVGGLVFVGSWDNNVYALNAATGTQVWNYTTGGPVFSSPAVVGGVVYVGSLDGNIYAFGPGVHDVAVTNVTLDKTVIGQGYNGNITVAVQNQGYFTEKITVNIYANTTNINTITNITLASGKFTSITFMWNTSGFVKGKYTIKAYAWPVPGETYTADNMLVFGTVIVTIPGDVVEPYFEVDIYDVTAICICYDSKIGQRLYNPNCDLDGNGIIDIYDVTAACISYGQKYP
jgi:outer membrane protein assembly factor BamB